MHFKVWKTSREDSGFCLTRAGAGAGAGEEMKLMSSLPSVLFSARSSKDTTQGKDSGFL